MAENIQPAGRCYLRGHGACIFRVKQAQGRLQTPARDASLGVHARQIKNADARGFAAGSGCGGNRDQGFPEDLEPASPLPMGGST